MCLSVCVCVCVCNVLDHKYSGRELQNKKFPKAETRLLHKASGVKRFLVPSQTLSVIRLIALSITDWFLKSG